MTRDEIIRTALADTILIDGIEQVARAAYEAGAAAEREACAKVCEEAYPYSVMHTDQHASKNCAAAIRARGEK
jgi:hypothetical protein